MRLAGDAVGAPGHEAPDLLIMAAMRRGMDHVVDLAAPARVILGLGHHLPVAQHVEEAQDLGLPAEKHRVERGQVRQRRVEEREPVIAAEDREPGGQIGKGLAQGLHEAALRLLGMHELRHIRGEDQRAVGAGARVEIVPARGIVERDADRAGLLERGARARPRAGRWSRHSAS